MRPEWAIEITGFVRERPEDTANPDLPTGEIDVVVNECTILNESATPPFPLDDDIDTDELTRMKWRYLDMRRTPGCRGPASARHRHLVDSQRPA